MSMEIMGREFQRRLGYALPAPVVEVSALGREEQLVTWLARVDTGSDISVFPERICGGLAPLVIGRPCRVQDAHGILREYTWRLPVLIPGDRGSCYESRQDLDVWERGLVMSGEQVGRIGMDILRGFILVVMDGKFWLLSPESFEVRILRRGGIGHVGSGS